MGNKTFVVVVLVVFVVLFAVNVWAIENPVGSATVPPSSVRSGLVRSPNPMDSSSNLVVTGNVGGGKHFRGVVPYNAISDFGGRLGSTSLDSFLRRSAGSGDFSNYTGIPTPYYSSTGAVTTTSPGLSGVFKTPTSRVESSATDDFAMPRLYRERVLSDSESTMDITKQLEGIQEPVSSIRTRPMSMSPEELEKVISSDLEKYSRSRKLRDEEHQSQTEQFQRDLKQVSEKAAELKRSFLEDGESLRISTKAESTEDILQRSGVKDSEKGIGEESQRPRMLEDVVEPGGELLDVYEQMKRQIGDFKKGTGQWSAAESAKSSATYEQQPTKQDSEEIKSEEMKYQSEGFEEISEADLFAARALLGKHKSFASFSEDKFNQYLRAAEGYMKEGRYYRAADAYTLASIYKPSDPLAYAGKSHALFAAGEYMSSALFLSRAIEIFPEYVQFDIDLVGMIGDKDKLESRIAEVRQWLKKSDAAELHFLLGYIYYQMGRFRWAKGAIDAAYEKMPQVPSIIVLKKAIYNAMGLPDGN